MKKFKLDTKSFFSELFDNEKATMLSKQLQDYNIETIEQLYGALNPVLPQFSHKKIKAKGLTTSYSTLSKKKNAPDKQIAKVKKTLGVTSAEAKTIVQSLDKINFPLLSLKNNESVYSLGLKSSSLKTRTDFWSEAVSIERSSSYVLPDYQKMGTVYNQGARGTCVANAYCALFDYVAGAETSRQFLYHQCKMTDGSKNSGGTYMHIPVKLMTVQSIVDYGIVKEEEWPYISDQKATEHQGPPPEHCFNTLRLYSTKPVKTRSESSVEDIKLLLAGSNMHKPVPVAVGLMLFESFNNAQSARTGWITMPLPGESKVGGHAMLIVGYFDDQKLFLVRNSWGTGWAPENSHGYPGHALIPYAYIENYLLGGGWSFLSMDTTMVKVPTSERLYNNSIHFNSSYLSSALKAARKNMKKPTKRRKPFSQRARTKSRNKNTRLKYFILGVIVTLLIVYHSEVAGMLEGIMHWIKKY